MPDEPNDNIPSTQLPLDDRAAAVIDELAAFMGAPDTEYAETREAIMARVLADSTRMQIGIGRSLRRDLFLLDEKRAELAMLTAEIAASCEPINRRIAAAEDTLAQIAIMRRERGLGNAFDIPGVGRWATRKKPARWEIDNAAVMASLSDDDRALYVDPGQPKPAEPKLKVAELRATLDEALAQYRASADLPDRPGGVDVIARALAAAYDGVTYVPEGIAVNYDLG